MSRKPGWSSNAARVVRRKLGSDLESPLWRTVMNGRRCRWSPEQIAGKLPSMNEAAIRAGQAMPANPMSVSHETIYYANYAMPRTTLRTELVGLLRRSHKTRLPRARGTARKGGLPNMTNTAIAHLINNRPRKVLDFRSPHRVYFALTANFIAGVEIQA